MGLRSRYIWIENVLADGSTLAEVRDAATTVKSNKDGEKHRRLGALGTMREWGTGRKTSPLHKESYDVENQKYELTLEVIRDEISDDQTGQIMLRVKELAGRAALHKDELLAALLNNGDQAGYLAYDGKIFFAADHESGVSGAQSNILTPAAVDPTDPTVAEFRTAMKAALARLLGLLDDQGAPMNLGATGLTAVVPPGMYITALEALNATIVDATTNVLTGAAKVVPFSRLTDASKAFLLKTDVPIRPFLFQDREPVGFKALDQDSEAGFLREVYLYGVRARYAMTYGAWQHALQLDFA